MTAAKILGVPALAAALLAAGGKPPAGGPPPAAGVIFVSRPAGAVADAPGRLPRGCRLLEVPLDGGGAPRDLAPGFAAAGSPSPSPDARRILLAGREREEDRDGIWEADAAGGAPRPVAAVAGGDLSAPALLPDGGVVFAGPFPGGRALFATLPDRSAFRRITRFAAGEDRDPAVLPDGRVLFVHAEGGREDLYAVHLDGTGIQPFHGRGLPAARRSRPRPGADGSLWLVEDGRPVRLDPRRPGRAGADAAPDLPGTAEAAEPLPGGGLLLSHRAEAGRPDLELRALRPGGPAAGAVLRDDPDRDETDPVVRAPRRPPQGHLLQVDLGRRRGSLFGIDARRTAGAPLRGAAAVRFLAAEEGGERVLGTVPLRGDGSFWADLPAEVPLRVQALDGAGAVLEDSGYRFWVGPGETRGCIGCHEDPAVAPPNRFPEAIRGEPADLAGGGGDGGGR